MNNQHSKHLLLLLLATLFISTSGALGRYINMSIPVIIWWRSIIAAVLLYAFCRYKKINLKIKSKKEIIPFIISGVFLAAHWITYFYALKMSNVAIGMLSLFTYPVITSFLEPIILILKFRMITIHYAKQ